MCIVPARLVLELGAYSISRCILYVCVCAHSSPVHTVQSSAAAPNVEMRVRICVCTAAPATAPSRVARRRGTCRILPVIVTNIRRGGEGAGGASGVAAADAAALSTMLAGRDAGCAATYRRAMRLQTTRTHAVQRRLVRLRGPCANGHARRRSSDHQDWRRREWRRRAGERRGGLGRRVPVAGGRRGPQPQRSLERRHHALGPRPGPPAGVVFTPVRMPLAQDRAPAPPRRRRVTAASPWHRRATATPPRHRAMPPYTARALPIHPPTHSHTTTLSHALTLRRSQRRRPRCLVAPPPAAAAGTAAASTRRWARRSQPR